MPGRIREDLTDQLARAIHQAYVDNRTRRGDSPRLNKSMRPWEELPPDRQRANLAQAKDIKAARQAFKPLSASLVKYLADNKAGRGIYHEAYCPMVKASWLQTEKTIKNPYMGKEMLTCGELKN